MSRQTVDFGIDLGTTNSVIARAGAKGVTVVKNGFQSDTTPSAVSKTIRGQLLLGQDALDKPDSKPAIQFKRLMGTVEQILMGDGSSESPEMLSAEVLKDLKASVQLRFDVEPEHAVITVPAMFQQPQCEATQRAAELAGLNAVMLLQEPIAAAAAYLNEGAQDGNYMVFDLGGGTFDVSIVRLRNREMSVVGHGGDNYLGGSDFDVLMYEWAVSQILMEHGIFPHLEQEPARYQLLKACERAKITLSTRESTSIDVGDLSLPIAQLSISRADLESMVEPEVTRCIRLARDRMDHAALAVKDIKSIFLVGGPTMMPYIRRRLKEEVGIPVSVDQDPMTVVAVGAAIHASGLLKPSTKTISSGKSLEANVELFYEPVVQDRETTMSGKVRIPEGFQGDIRVSRASADWDTGWLALRDGAFVCDLLLDNTSATEFVISLRDITGTVYTVDPSTITIRYGIAAAQPVTPYKYGVAVEGGEFAVVVDDNKPLPTYGKHVFAAAKTVLAGTKESLSIYFLEGLSKVARENVKVGELRIEGEDLQWTLREGEKVEVRIYMDESRLLRAKVMIPTYDLTYDVQLRSNIDTPSIEDLRASMFEVQASMTDIKEVVGEEDKDVLILAQDDLDRVEADLDNRKRLVEVGAGAKVAKKLSDVKQRMRPLSDRYGIRSRYDETMEIIDSAEEISLSFKDEIGAATARDLREDAKKALRLDDFKGVEAVRQRALGLFWQHYPNTSDCWSGMVEYLRENRWRATDQAAYHENVKRAEECLVHGDNEGVRLNAVAAAAYLPPRVSYQDRFFDAGLRKR